MAEIELQRTAKGEQRDFPCDFCGDRVSRVRRIALDRDYDRLKDASGVRYACEPCSERKERLRLGMARG